MESEAKPPSGQMHTSGVARHGTERSGVECRAVRGLWAREESPVRFRCIGISGYSDARQSREAMERMPCTSTRGDG